MINEFCSPEHYFNTPHRTPPSFIKYESIVSPVGSFDLRISSESPLQVFEKIDGGNCQVRNVNWQLYPGNRANYLKGNIIKARPWFEKFTRWVYSNSSLYKLPANVVMFGEWSGNHTLEYNPKFKDIFFVIDVLDINNNRFLPYYEGKNLLERLGIRGVHYLKDLAEGRKVTPMLLEQLLQESSDYRDDSKEGILVKDYIANPQKFAKIYHPDFAEKRRLPNGEIDCLTISRFRKAAFRIIESGSSLSYDALIADVRKNVNSEEGINCDPRDIRARLDEYIIGGDITNSPLLGTAGLEHS